MSRFSDILPIELMAEIHQFAGETLKFDMVMRQLESLTIYTEVESDEELITVDNSWFDEEEQLYADNQSFVNFIRVYGLHNINLVETRVTNKIVCYEEDRDLTQYELERFLNEDVEPVLQYHRDMAYVLELSKTYQ